MTDYDVHIRISEVMVSAVPEIHELHDSFAVKVEWRGFDRYAVIRRKQCLGTDGAWDYEQIPSERAADWIGAHRFDYDEAIRLARQACLEVRINGMTVDDALAEVGR